MRGSEFASLRAQLTRAADSVATNIVEGAGAASAREFARDLDISVKSAAEAEYHLMSAKDRGALSEERWLRLSVEAVSIRRMTYVYRNRVLEDADK
jgi:four helix bundle protein